MLRFILKYGNTNLGLYSCKLALYTRRTEAWGMVHTVFQALSSLVCMRRDGDLPEWRDSIDILVKWQSHSTVFSHAPVRFTRNCSSRRRLSIFSFKSRYGQQLIWMNWIEITFPPMSAEQISNISSDLLCMHLYQLITTITFFQFNPILPCTF